MAIEEVLTFLGLVVTARWTLYLVLDLLAALRKFVLANLWSDKDLAVKYDGNWAVVTGCTDGIGKEYARQLSGRGMNILLIARNMKKLNNIQQLLKDESPDVETEIVQADFSDGRPIYPNIEKHLQNKNIGILVNNVGMSLSSKLGIKDLTEDHIWNYVNVNVASVVAMTRLVLDKMVAKRKGAIINVASIASSLPIKTYSATKVFVDFFSESLRWECKDSGVVVQTLRPGIVLTNMTASFAREPSLFQPDVVTYVTSALSTLGHAGYTAGYWPHGLQAFLMDVLINQELIKMLFLAKKGKPSTTKQD